MRAQFLPLLRSVLASASIFLVVLVWPVCASADEAVAPSAAYQLEVSINGQPTGLIASFTDTGDGRFSSPASELRQLGIAVPAEVRDEELIPLSSFRGLSYVYDEQKQTIAIETGDENRVRAAYDARGESSTTVVTPSDFGAVVNYDIFSTVSSADGFSDFSTDSFSGVNTTLDARITTPIGLFNQTAIVGSTLAGETDALRLESTYTFSDDENMVRWRGGDFISGGTAWSRPIRMGGAQAQRAFSMRPDLVTTPLPVASGSAAVPSTVDVYVNGIKAFSKDVAAGPYQIQNIPAISGSGTAQVVTRDASGKETIQSLAFYTSPQLLKPGLYDFSVESGLPRRNYGIESNDYGDGIIGMATLRAGITDWLTAETHAEGGEGLTNGGAGVVANVFDRGIVSGAASYSSSGKGQGYQLYGSASTRLGPVSIGVRSQHSFEEYDDLASLTATAFDGSSTIQRFATGGIAGGFFNYAPPRAVDSITISTPLIFDRSTISATYLRYETEDRETSQLVTATYTRPLVNNANLFATGFTDLDDTRSSGFYLGINMPLDNDISLAAGVARQNGGYGANIDASKQLGQEAGSWGWRLRDHEGEGGTRSAGLSYRAAAARAEVAAYQDGGGVRATGEVEGAVAVIGGDVYASNRIDDSFAVVDAHAPDVKVQRENLLVGQTNEDGKILVPNLVSYQKNRIAIDPLDLPMNTEMDTASHYVTPGYRSGLYVDFNVKAASANAIVILKDANGAFLQPGTEAKLEGSDEPILIGYDGQAFVKDLKAVNILHVTNGSQSCIVQFTYEPNSQTQPVLGPETCQ